MIGDTEKQGGGSGSPEAGPCQRPGAMCSMSKMCMGMMGKRPSGLLLLFPGVLLIALGALIIVEPQILVWLLAAASAFLGIMLLLMAGFVRRMGAPPRA